MSVHPSQLLGLSSEDSQLPLVLSFGIGGGTGSAGDITISLDRAQVVNLSAGLVSDTLATSAGAALAVTNVTAATNKLAEIEATVDSLQQRFSSALTDLEAREGITQAAQSERLTPQITLDVSLHVADQLLEDQGIIPDLRTAQIMRQFLLAIDQPITQEPNDREKTEPVDPASRNTNKRTAA